jgi:hypothetical protein
MRAPRRRVSVGVEPYVLRTALHGVLRADRRFEALLCPEDVEPAAHVADAGADAAMVSASVDVEALTVLVLDLESSSLAIRSGRGTTAAPYAGLDDLAERLAAALAP